jgi:hypothetical protein
MIQSNNAIKTTFYSTPVMREATRRYSYSFTATITNTISTQTRPCCCCWPFSHVPLLAPVTTAVLPGFIKDEMVMIWSEWSFLALLLLSLLSFLDMVGTNIIIVFVLCTKFYVRSVPHRSKSSMLCCNVSTAGSCC